jgi:hypothetical protein
MAKAEMAKVTCNECDGSGLIVELAQHAVARRSMLLSAFRLGNLPSLLRVKQCPSCFARKAAEAKAVEGKKG